MDIRLRFGRRIQELRHAKGYSQEELAFRAGLHRTYVGAIERGQRNVSIINVKRLADALEVDLSTLFQNLE